MIQIGTVEILKSRIYEDRETGDDLIVEPSICPVFLDEVTFEVFWVMQGRWFIPRGIENMGDGLFLVRGDEPVGETVLFSSPRFSWHRFQTMGEVREEGHPEQRLRFHVDDLAEFEGRSET